MWHDKLILAQTINQSIKQQTLVRRVSVNDQVQSFSKFSNTKIVSPQPLLFLVALGNCGLLYTLSSRMHLVSPACSRNNRHLIQSSSEVFKVTLRPEYCLSFGCNQTAGKAHLSSQNTTLWRFMSKVQILTESAVICSYKTISMGDKNPKFNWNDRCNCRQMTNDHTVLMQSDMEYSFQYCAALYLYVLAVINRRTDKGWIPQGSSWIWV